MAQEAPAQEGNSALRDGEAVNKMLASVRAIIGMFPDERQFEAAVETYAGIVPADAWAIWLERADEEPVGLLSEPLDHADERFGIVRREAQRAAGRHFAVEPAQGPLEPYGYGLSVSVDGAGANRGVLVLLRRADLGEFNLDDQAVLLEGRIEFCETLKYLDRLSGGVDLRDWAQSRKPPVTIVMNDDFTIDCVSRSEADGRGEFGAPLEPGRRLPDQIERAVREATSTWDLPERRVETLRTPMPGLIVRVIPLERSDRYAIGLTLERYRERSGLGNAAQRFGLTNREIEVIALLLSGLGTANIGSSLHVSESTVSDHVKRILEKVGAANRTEMAAKVLGWRSG